MSKKRERDEDGMGAVDPSGLSLVRELRADASTAFASAATTLLAILDNVLQKPDEPRYRSIRLANSTFHSRVGQYAPAIRLLKACGFEEGIDAAAAAVKPTDADSKPEAASAERPTHLVLAVADASLLARHVTLLAAAIEAAKQLDGERSSNSERSADVASYDVGAASSSVGAASSDAAMKLASASELELTSYTIGAVESFFSQAMAAALGEHDRKPHDLATAAELDRIISIAADAARVATDQNDVEVFEACERWIAHLREHRELLGVAEDADAEIGMGDDGNVENCVICGGTGTLVCCDGCPMAYHAVCLGEKAPPEDDDGEWLCPSCAGPPTSAGSAGAGTSS